VALGEAVFANVAAALAGGRHVLLVGPSGSGKTALAVAVAEAAVAAGRTPGLTLVTAGEALARQALAAGRTGRWLVADELDRAPAGWASGAFLAGLAVTIGSDQIAAPPEWRVVATAPSVPPDLPGAFAVIDVGPHPDLEGAIRAAAGGDAVAAAAVIGLLPGDGQVGAGRFLAAAAHAAARRAEAPADEATLAREVRAAYRL
jgi:MoxR-like ATPase